MLATDNPIEYEGTYELPEAQLDRFLMRLRLGYLSTGDETAMLRRRVDRAREEVELSAVTSAEGVLAMRDSLEQVEVTPDLLDYIVAIVNATRHDPQVQIGASPRGGLALVQLARGQALLNSRDYAVPDDIKQVAVPALAHRMTLRPELWVRQVSSDDVMAKLLSSVPTPKTDPGRRPDGRAAAPRPRPPPAEAVSHDPERSRGARTWHRARAALEVVAARPAAAHARAGRAVHRRPGPAPRVRGPGGAGAASARGGAGAPAAAAHHRAGEAERPAGLRGRAAGRGRGCAHHRGGPGRVRGALAAAPGLEIAPVGAAAADGPRARFVVTPERWGRLQIGTLEVTLRDRWRLAEGHVSTPLPRLDCYPAPAQQRTRVVLRRLPNRLGEHPARVSGEGIEFSGVREYVPGDRQRSINWPASTRRGRLQVNTFAAERSQDVVLLVDATSDVGEPGSSALDLALRGAGAAARAYTDARDRVGVITYQWGGSGWLPPGLGRRQVYRIIDSMMASAPLGTQGWARGASFARLPRAALPPGALVVVFSPLLDQRFVEALRDMRERGFTMLVVDVLTAEPPARRRAEDRMARRIWRMEQEAIRFSLRELGVPVVHWDGEESLDLPLAAHTRRPMAARR